MTNTNEFCEYNILGCNVRFKTDENENINPKEVVDSVLSHIETMRSSSAGLSDLEIAVLTALKFSSDNKQLEKDYQGTIEELKVGISEALQQIEDVRPTTTQ